MDISDTTRLKLAKDIDRGFTRPKYEDLLVELKLFTRAGLENYSGARRKIDFVLLTFDELQIGLHILLEELNKRWVFSDESLHALAEDGVEFDHSVTDELAELANEGDRLDDEALKKRDAEIEQPGSKIPKDSRTTTDRIASDENQLRAKLQGVESALEMLEAEYKNGTIDIGRYLQLKTKYATHKAKLEQELNLAHGQQTSATTHPEHLQGIIDYTQLETLKPARTMDKINTVLGWNYSQEDLKDFNIPLLLDFGKRLGRIPDVSRQLLIVIVKRADDIVLESEVKNVCRLSEEHFSEQYQILIRHNFIWPSEDYYGYPAIQLLNNLDGWPIWNDLRLFCNKTGISLYEIIVHLRFDLLD